MQNWVDWREGKGRERVGYCCGERLDGHTLTPIRPTNVSSVPSINVDKCRTNGILLAIRILTMGRKEGRKEGKGREGKVFVLDVTRGVEA